MASVASLQGTAAEELSQVLQEKEQVLTALQGALGERERERNSLKEQVLEKERQLTTQLSTITELVGFQSC